MTQILIKDGKAFALATHGEFSVPEELPSLVITNTPAIRFSGPKIPLAEWKRVLAFFEAVFKATRSECQVRLYRHRKTGEWKAWAFPQTKNSGMTTKECPESPLWAKAQAMFGDDWMHFGSVHHHCTTSAFQSGTDRADEVGNAVSGLHITVGFMDKSVYDIHARAVVSVVGELDEQGNVKRRARIETGDVILSDWFDVGVDLDKIPAKYRGDIVKDLISYPSTKDDAFPGEWLDNLVERQWSNNVTGFGSAIGNSHWNYQGNNYHGCNIPPRTPSIKESLWNEQQLREIEAIELKKAGLIELPDSDDSYGWGQWNQGT